MTDARRGRLAQILEPYKTQAIANATGRSRQSVHSLKTGASLPDVSTIPSLAAFLRIEVGELTSIVAADAQDRDGQNASVRGAA